MLNKLSTKIIFLFISFFLNGCLHETNSKNEELNNKFLFGGYWVSQKCEYLESFSVTSSDTEYYIESIIFENDYKLKSIVTIYVDSSCSEATGYEIITLSNYRLGNLIITDSGLEAYEIQSNVQSVEIFDSNNIKVGSIEPYYREHRDTRINNLTRRLCLCMGYPLRTTSLQISDN